VTILRISASGSPTVPSSGSASRLRSSLRLRSTVPPRVQLRPQLAPPTEPLALLSCPSIDLRRSNEPSGLTVDSVVSLHRRLSLQFCFPARRSTCVSRPAFRPHLRSVRQLSPPTRFRFCFLAALQLALSFSRSASPLAPLVSLRRQLRLRICLPARPFDLRRTSEPSSLALRSILSLRRRWTLRLCLPACRLTCVARPAFQPYLPT
jgi:hypothetical protein